MARNNPRYEEFEIFKRSHDSFLWAPQNKLMKHMKKYILTIVLSFITLNAFSEYVVDQETISVDLNGVSIAYTTAGNQEDPAVLMIMGLMASHKVWGEEIVNSLVNSGYRVILFDNRDTGDSEKLDRLGKPNLYWKFFFHSKYLYLISPELVHIENLIRKKPYHYFLVPFLSESMYQAYQPFLMLYE